MKYTLNTGLQRYKEQGTKGAKAELKQIHDKLTSAPIKKIPLTQQQRTDAICVLMFLKENWCGKVKGRMCTDSRKQLNAYNKTDSTSPTVSIESVLIATAIDSYENQYVTTVDVPGALLTSDMN